MSLLGLRVRVRIHGRWCHGTVAYAGEVLGKDGVHVGVVFDRNVTDTNGTYLGTEYFPCRRGYGGLFTPDRVFDTYTGQPLSEYVHGHERSHAITHARRPSSLKLSLVPPRSTYSADFTSPPSAGSPFELPAWARVEADRMSTMDEALQRIAMMESLSLAQSEAAEDYGSHFYTHEARLADRAAQWGLRINPATDATGDCQFDAIADQLRRRCALEGINKEEVRRRTVAWLRTHDTHIMESGMTLHETFAEFETSYSSLDDYCDAMEQPKRWGDYWTLVAATEEFNVRIVVFSSTESEDESTHRLFFGPEHAPVVLFLGHIIELHYVSLIDADS